MDLTFIHIDCFNNTSGYQYPFWNRFANYRCFFFVHIKVSLGELSNNLSVVQKKGKGSGFGIFISKTLVDRYNGQISIESRYPDDFSKGTQISVILNCISD